MIDIQVQEVLDMLNSQLHGRVDYNLFSQIFDEVASIGVPQGYKLVPVEATDEMRMAAYTMDGDLVGDTSDIYKAMIGAVE